VGDGFDFTRPEKREAKSFEPPPWEAAAFEELRRQRAEEERAAEDAGTTEQPSMRWVALPQEEGDSEEGSVDQPPRRVDEGEVMLMMAGLAAEEPSVEKGLHTAAIVAAAVMAAFGTVLMVWGVVALAGSRESGRVGVIGGSLFFFFGVAATGFAVWLIVRTLRQRGVL